jgi:hypothetical protein
VYTWNAKGANGAVSTSKLTAAPGGARHIFAFPGALGGAAPSSVAPNSLAGHSFKAAPSAQLQAAFKNLQTDEKSLMAQIPASVTSAVTTDQATIQQALSSLTPTQWKALHSGGAPSGTTSGTTSSNPTANMTATLTEAGVSSSQITAIETDFKNLQTAMTTTDPTLQAQITADKAAIAQDGGPSLPANGPGMGMPGRF